MAEQIFGGGEYDVVSRRGSDRPPKGFIGGQRLGNNRYTYLISDDREELALSISQRNLQRFALTLSPNFTFGSDQRINLEDSFDITFPLILGDTTTIDGISRLSTIQDGNKPIYATSFFTSDIILAQDSLSRKVSDFLQSLRRKNSYNY